MPITQAESGLTANEYAEVQTLKDLPAYSVIAERYNLSFRLRRDKGRVVAGTDTVVSGSYLVRAYVIGAAIYAEQSPAGGDDWTLKLTIAAGVDSSVAPSSVVSGNTIRLFYYTGTNVAYRESADNGSTWAGEVVVGAQANVSMLAASYLTRVHVASYTPPNTRLHYWEDDGGWSKTDSDIYWPYTFDGFDSNPITSSKDLLVFSTYLQTRYDDTRQGIVGMFESNGRWSEHFDIDVVDEGTSYRYRRYPRLTKVGDLHLLTFYGSDGTEDNPIADRCSTRSKDGRWWEKRTFSICDEAGYASLLVLGSFAYMVGTGKSFISAATRYAGYTPESGDDAYYGELRQDIIRSLTSEMSRMRQTNMIISDEGSVYSAGIFSENNTILLRYHLGYQSVTYGDLLVPYSMEEVDFFRLTTALSFKGVQVSSRDRMAWLVDPTRAADHTREWESQLLGRDRFKDDTGTGYGGLRHTAGDGGHWRTEDERLKLLTSNEVRQAHNTLNVGIGNGVIRSGIMFASDGNSELIGLTFRCQTVDGDGFSNYFRVCFEDASDTICLRKVVDGIPGVVLATSGALGWSAGTQYYLMAEFRYKRYVVYYSTDGISWTQAFAYVDVGTVAGSFAMVEGYVGYVGQGYSDEDEEDPEQDPDPPEGDPGDDWPVGTTGSIFIADINDGVFFKPDGVESWRVRDDALTAGLTDTQQLGWDPWWKTPLKQNSSDLDNAILFRCHVGDIWRTINGGFGMGGLPGTGWYTVTPSSDPPNDWDDSPAPTVGDLTFKQRVDNIHVNGQHIFLAEWQNGDDDWRSWLLKTTDDGTTWEWGSLSGGQVNPWHASQITDQGADVTVDFQDKVGGSVTGAPYYVIDELDEIIIYFPFTVPAGTEIYEYSRENPRNLGLGNMYDWDGGAWNKIGNNLGNNFGWTHFTTVNACSVFRLYMDIQFGVDDDGEFDALYWDLNLETRVLWADVDTEDGSILWMTVWRSGTLYIESYLTSTLTRSTQDEIGTATQGEMEAGTYTAYPMTPYGDKLLCYVYGRMNDPQGLGTAHIIKTDDGGSSFSLVKGGWGSDICASLQVGQINEDKRRMMCVRNNGDGTSEFWWGDDDIITKSADITFEVNVDAFSVSSDGVVAVGNMVAGGTDQVRFAGYPYEDFINITYGLYRGDLTGIMSVTFI